MRIIDMPLTTIQKHNLGVNLVSDYLNYLGHEHIVNTGNSDVDICVPETGKKIKIFCNFSRLPNIKIPNTFKPQEGILYLVVTPTKRNNVGFTSRGGTKNEIKKFIKSFSSPDAPKNLLTGKLKNSHIRKYLIH